MGSSTISLGLGLGGGKAATSSGSPSGGGFPNQYSVSLDGSNDYVTGNSTTTIGSISMWIKAPYEINRSQPEPSSGLGYQVCFGQSGGDFIFGLGPLVTPLTNEIITFSHGGTRYAACSTSNVLSANTWHHLFASWQTSSETNPGGNGYDIWVNGVKATDAGNNGWTTDTSGTAKTSPDSLANGFKLGSRSSGSYFFNGLIDEFALWSGDVSSYVANIYNAGAGAVDLSDSSVVGTTPEIWWRNGDDNGGEGATVTNQGSEGSSANGTLTNGPTFSTDVPS